MTTRDSPVASAAGFSYFRDTGNAGTRWGRYMADKGKLAVEYRSTNDLIPYANNTRTHSDEQVSQIASSIKEFGFTNPVLVDEDGGIIAGHGRVMAAKRLNMDSVPIITLKGLTKAQKKAYIIADNKLALNAGWDDELLRIELQDLDEMGYDLTLTGFGGEELEEIFADNGKADGLTDEDDAPEVPDEPVTREGDLWILGSHRLLCGDSTNINAVEKLMGGRQADQLITNPPYNVALGMNETVEDAKRRNRRTDGLVIKTDSMSDGEFRQFLRDVYASADAVMKPGAVFYIWHADSEGYNFRGAASDVGWTVRQCLIWKKQTMVMGRQDYHWKHETCLYGWKDGAGHLWASDRKQTTILEFDRPQRNDVHPTMKPVALIEYQVLNNTKGGDLVLDLFGGSGSTMIACEKNGRHNCSMELDPKYCDVIVKRWQEFTGKDAVLESDGRTFNEVSNGKA